MSPLEDRSRFSKTLARLNAARVIPLRRVEWAEDIALTIGVLVRLPSRWESSLRSFLTSFRMQGLPCRRNSEVKIGENTSRAVVVTSFLALTV